MSYYYPGFIGYLRGFDKGSDVIGYFFIGNLRVIYTDFIRDLSGIYKSIMHKLASIVFPWSDTYFDVLYRVVMFRFQ